MAEELAVVSSYRRGRRWALAALLAFMAPIVAGGHADAQPAGVIPQSTSVASAALIAKAAPGQLMNWQVTTGASAGYVLIFDSATIPADGAVAPVKCYAVGATTSFQTGNQLTPAYFRNGVVLVFSTGSSCFVKAQSPTAFLSADVE